ncbi:dr1-associated corepressor [Neocloeon triangulifer]|uniref:dr1-associated corepressor n=1 Tax=Neocloeon triangulifer TaxID=2078957 RepID=UPI00286F9E1E|nr:dr1-associated corepressor [Neocloeon triangulifer]
MPSKKKKYNSRFPPGRIKKIMQTDDEVGKVAQAVPVIIPRALELFVESLLTKAVQITTARNAKTLTPSHMKHCILSESRFDFLKEFVKTVPDLVGDTDDIPGSSTATPSLEEFASPPMLTLPNGVHIAVGPSDSAAAAVAIAPAVRHLPVPPPLEPLLQPTLPAVPPLIYFPQPPPAKSKAPFPSTSSPSHLEIDEDYDAV